MFDASKLDKGDLWALARQLYFVWYNSLAPDAWNNMSLPAQEQWRNLAVFVVEAGSFSPIPMRLMCESCGELHIDVGDFATKPHKHHTCQKCGLTWKPADVPTVGVQFLPGHKNATP